MSRLNLTVESVDSGSTGGTNTSPTRTGIAISRIKSSFTKGRSSRTTWGGGTDYSDDKVANILRDFLQSDSKTKVTEAATSLLALFPDNAPGNREVWSFGRICVELAEQIPYHHPSQIKFVQLLSFISRSPKVTSSYPWPTLQSREETYAPLQLLREALTDSVSEPMEDFRNDYVNAHAFQANLTAAGIWGMSPGKSVMMLRQAFESKRPEAWEWECDVMAAAQWIIWSGQTLFKFILCDSEDMEEEIPEEKGGYWRTGESLRAPEKIRPRSVERWRFWNAGFEAVDQDADAGEECKRLARRAGRLMGCIEEGMSFSERSDGHQT